jgi:uncharacterized protein YyaL (SSP411 family)
MTKGKTTNRLAHETSPYLLQHAHNPVDWYPWGREALDRARQEDRPILLSIGYAACHWCHVMERESFEDPDTAALMNEHFIPIKVDREERPDLDGIYTDAVQAMSGHGGWPMTVFLTPEGEPFFAGTYFPPEDRGGLPAFRTVLRAIAEAWRDRREDARRQAGRVLDAVRRSGALRASADPLSEDILRQAFSQLESSLDREWGGFGAAPKFPQPMTVEFVLRCHLRGYPGAVEIASLTLDRMAAGGMYDHVGGGFHRYSVDARWHVPHFEKMLYDNAQLARLYTRAFQITARPRYREVATQTFDYLLREMRDPAGGFHSSQDADSEGVEGKFFGWSHQDLVEVGGEAVAAYFGAVPAGNWEGVNVLWTPLPMHLVAAEFGLRDDELGRRVETARQQLFELREGRVRPATDDKVLAAWNGLAISALAEGGRVLGVPGYVAAARAAAEFVLDELRDGNGRLLRSWRQGKAGGPGYLDDHALMAEACLTLYETTFDVRFFREARALCDAILTLFRDDDGGFFQTGSDAEPLIVRPKELFDNAVPSGNSVAAEVLQRMALFTGDSEYERAGSSGLRLVRDLMARAPGGFGHALGALDLYVSSAREVAVIGDPDGPDTRRLVEQVWGRFMPNRVLATAAPDDRSASDAIPLLSGRTTVNGRAAAYVCERFVCQRPVTDPEELAGQLAG